MSVGNAFLVGVSEREARKGAGGKLARGVVRLGAMLVSFLKVTKGAFCTGVLVELGIALPKLAYAWQRRKLVSSLLVPSSARIAS